MSAAKIRLRRECVYMHVTRSRLTVTLGQSVARTGLRTECSKDWAHQCSKDKAKGRVCMHVTRTMLTLKQSVA